jgi:hypothetical protein
MGAVMRARVHKNLHRDCWSLITPGAKVEHRAYVLLGAGVCRVQPGGRARVLATRSRSVHAYVVGELLAQGDHAPPRGAGWVRFSYNPYRAGHFVTAEGAPLSEAAQMRFDSDGAWFRLASILSPDPGPQAAKRAARAPNA